MWHLFRAMTCLTGQCKYSCFVREDMDTLEMQKRKLAAHFRSAAINAWRFLLGATQQPRTWKDRSQKP